MNKPRLRFAPSPTGYLHIGGLRTALFNYLIAKSLGGKLILRIEDTDQKRRVEGAQESLIEILKWVGIEFDEGPHCGGKYGPYIQSQRINIYNQYTQELLDKGAAYRCFCTSQRLEQMRRRQQADKLPPRYDRHCRNLNKEEVQKRLQAGEKFVIRQKMPLDGEVVVKDELRGEIKFKAEELEDHVLVKSDGMPTYQLANVVDDHLMEISHVVRGEEWIPSLPKNILLYQALGWRPPKFIHPPLILNKGGGKLSKRQGDVAVEDYRRQGYLPEALINFCALLGWHPKGDNEIYTLEELVKVFKIEDMRSSAAIFDIEKLNYFNGYYIRHADLDRLTELCRPFLEPNLRLTNKAHKHSEQFLRAVVAMEQERLKKLADITELSAFLFKDKLEYDCGLLIWKKMTPDQVKSNLEIIYRLLNKIPEDCWTDDSIEEAVVSYIQARGARVGEFLWPMRVALSGQKASPPPFAIAEALGKEESLARIQQAIDFI